MGRPEKHSDITSAEARYEAIKKEKPHNMNAYHDLVAIITNCPGTKIAKKAQDLIDDEYSEYKYENNLH